MKFFLLIYTLLILPFTLFASNTDISISKGTAQESIAQLLPTPEHKSVSRYVEISVSFNIPLDAAHVKKFDVKLKCLSCSSKSNISGTVAYNETENKVTFTPEETLTPGLYEVAFKSLKADKAHKSTNIKEIKYRFVVVEEVLESITVTPNSLNLIEGETVQLTVTGKYDNGIEKEMMSQVAWIVDDTQTVSVNANGLVTALHAGNTNIKAKLTDVTEAGEVVSNAVPVEVLIPDVIAPIITLNGEKTITLHQNATYEELGATALDERDGEVDVTVEGSVDTSKIGNYAILYSAKDKAGNEATLTRTVHVVLPPDVTPPVLTINGESTITLHQGATYTEPGATAQDERDGSVVVNISGNVDTSVVGQYTVTYTATDSAGNSATLTRTVNVIDVTPPSLTLNGQANITLEQFATYSELGATATDAVDGTLVVTITGSVDTTTVGTYTLTYSTIDFSGNEANATRVVTVIDVTAPVITLNGDQNITLIVGESYEELGATASDIRDGDVNVTIDGSVDTSVEGTYSITYTAIDNAGNEVSKVRTVNVVAPTISGITVESNVTTLNVGESAQLTVQATYSDGSSEVLSENIEFIVTPDNAVDVNGSVITAKKDGNVTVEAKVGNALSNTLNLTITWVVNGHVLPPEPDPVINNSTLLGVDVNDNGVRDDVERWIYKEYKDKHPIHIDIAMQGASAKQKMLQDPTKAKEIHDEVVAPLDCESYFKVCLNQPIINERINGKLFRKIIFNTLERESAYTEYDTLLSGDSYTIPRCKNRKLACDFNTSKYGE